jgi:hypothetical protein
MSWGITICGIDGQKDVPGDYESYCQNLGAERDVFEFLKKKKVSKFYDLVNWNFTDGEEGDSHKAEAILSEAEKVKVWLEANEDWAKFEHGREPFMQDLGEMLKTLQYGAKKKYSFTLDYC